MNISNFFKSLTLISAVCGLLLGSFLTFLLTKNNSVNLDSNVDKDEPLYWVAPMDPNYRRDGPGKSPMGMDLIPVFQKDESTNISGPGTISIDANVVNNIGVRTARVESKILEEKIRTVAYVKYDENKLIHIHPRASGWVDKLYVTASGDPVKLGQPLYSLYSPELVNVQEEFVLALNRNNLRLIKSARERLVALQIPLQFIQNLEKTKNVKQSITFYSPQNGVVDNLNIREGFFVEPGTTLFSIGALDSVWVEVEVFERQLALIRRGASVSMTLDYLPGELWEGEIDYIYPVLDQMTRTVRLRLKFENLDKKLLPNMFAQVVIESETEEELLLIPQESLIRTGSQNRVVLALGEGRFKSIAVTTGRESQEHVEVLKGLQLGEEIVVSAQFLLDSESSINSDFLRMQNDNNVQTAIANGLVNSINQDLALVNVTRGPIEKWNRPAATMDFNLSKTLNLSQFSVGDQIEFEFEIHDQKFVITRLIDKAINIPLDKEGNM